MFDLAATISARIAGLENMAVEWKANQADMPAKEAAGM